MPDDESLFKRIVAGLSQSPSYLLVFGVSALFFLPGLGTTIAGLASTNNMTLLLGLLSFLIALVATVYVVRQVERTGVEKAKLEVEKLRVQPAAAAKVGQ
jgi:hypothetical protein